MVIDKQVVSIFVFVLTLGSAHMAKGERFLPTNDCVFAALVFKKGLASTLAHNHFIHHSLPEAVIEFDSKSHENSKFSATFPVGAIEVDDFSTVSRVQQRLQELSLIKEPFSKIEDKDRTEIRKNMMASDQLNAEKYPTGSIMISSPKMFKDSDPQGFNYSTEASVTLLDKSVVVLMRTAFKETPEGLSIESYGSSKFSSFGIKPYSAFFGAVGNQDDITFYVQCTAKKI